MANLLSASILAPNDWSTNTLNRNMIEGDRLYSQIRSSSIQGQIPESGDFNAVKNDITMFDNSFLIQFNEESDWYGRVMDSENDGVLNKTVLQSLNELFADHQAGLLISSSKSYGVIHYDGKYYFTYSHSCGPKGAPAANWRACIIECNNIVELDRVLKRSTSKRMFHT